MTKDEILNMLEGKEIDDLVAIHVMKWHIEKQKYRDCWVNADNKYMCGVSKEDEYPDCEDLHCLIWYPSSSMVWAWEVVEKFMNDGWCPNLVNDDNGHWALSFDGTQNFPTTVQISFIDYQELWCEAAPLAICRAALLAVLP